MRSLRGRLWLLWGLTLLASIGVAVLLEELYETSTTAQLQRAEAVVARGCGLIGERYAFFNAGSAAPAPAGRELVPVIEAALAHQAGVAGGVWSGAGGLVAYAFPTGRGAPPSGEELRLVAAVNADAAAADQAVLRQLQLGSQDVLLEACPLDASGGLTAWTMARVVRTGGFDSLRAGLALLGGLVLVIAGGVTWLTVSWGRQVRRIEQALRRNDIEELPRLAPTGERELDRVVAALNEAGERITQERGRAAALAGQVAAAEHMASLGRVAAGLAHEIRNPMAAMRLRAENALAGDGARLRPALQANLDQIGRVDRLLGEMLAMTQRRAPVPGPVDLAVFLQARAEAQRERAEAAGVALAAEGAGQAVFDAELIGRAVDNLVLNALHHTPAEGRVAMRGDVVEGRVRITVSDTGPGVAEALRQRLFEPFATGRPDGTGLGLAIAREMAEAHGGTLRLAQAEQGATFVLELPAP